MRIAILALGVTASVDSCLVELRRRGVEILVVTQADIEDAAFTRPAVADGAQFHAWAQAPDPDELVGVVNAFRPDAILVAGWGGPPAYRAVTKAQRGRALRILAMDNLWLGTPKQWLGRVTHRMHIDPHFDCVLVPSDRSEWFARRLGFDADEIIRGMYSADVSVFRSVRRGGAELAGHRRFLFIGRLVAQKNVDVLADAYRTYRCAAPDPWGLDIVGMGPLEHLVRDLSGVRLLGFVQPPRLAEMMRSSSAFVLPSAVEPYGIVVHEAAASGLPILCTDMAGAGPGLVQDGYNGWIVPAGNHAAWAAALQRMSGTPPERLAEMSRISRALAARLSPAGWARNLHEEIARRLSDREANRGQPTRARKSRK